MDRREFLEQVAAWSAGALATPVFNVRSILAAEESPRASRCWPSPRARTTRPWSSGS